MPPAVTNYAKPATGLNGDGSTSAQFVVAVFLGAGILLRALLELEVSTFVQSDTFGVSVTTILAVGLYAAIASISIDDLVADRRRIATVLTVGIVAKILLNYGAFSILGLEFAFAIALVFSQIDPLGTATLEGKRGSGRSDRRVSNLIRSWATFDDPITTILLVSYVFWRTAPQGPGGGLGPLHLFEGADLLNSGAPIYAGIFTLAVCLVTFLLVKLRPSESLLSMASLATVVSAIVTGSFWGLIVGGVFFRPRWLVSRADSIVFGAYVLSALLLGTVLTGQPFGVPLLIAVVALVSHIVSATLLSGGLPAAHRVKLALAQRSGITAISLSLYLASQGFDVLKNVGYAILWSVVLAQALELLRGMVAPVAKEEVGDGRS